MSLFSWSAAAFALVDEPHATLVAWDPNIDAPTWQRQLPRRILAIAGGGAMLATLDEGGTVAFWNGRDGASVGLASSPGGRLLALAWGNGCAVAAADRIDVLDARGQRSLPIAGATALRFSRDDTRLAIGFPDGLVTFVDVASGAAIASAQVASKGAPVLSLFERAPGAEWLVAAGDSLHAVERVGDPATRRVTGMGGATLKAVTANERGTLVALQSNDDLAVVLAWPSRDTAGNLRYPERKVTGIALGSKALWVGLDLGDGNKLDLATGDLYRTDPHQGRPRNRWLVSTGHHPEIARPAL
jgi:hypothetical protein